MGILMDKATSYEDLRTRVTKAFGGYFAQGAEVVQGLKAGPVPVSMLPPAVAGVIERWASGDLAAGAFEYQARYHLNRS